MTRELCIEYFKAFVEKDLSALSDMFSDSVALKDWEVDVSGKEAVLAANKDIFQSIDDLRVEVSRIRESGVISVCEIKIFADNNEFLVTDVIGFNSDNKIEFIRALQGWYNL